MLDLSLLPLSPGLLVGQPIDFVLCSSCHCFAAGAPHDGENAATLVLNGPRCTVSVAAMCRGYFAQAKPKTPRSAIHCSVQNSPVRSALVMYIDRYVHSIERSSIILTGLHTVFSVQQIPLQYLQGLPPVARVGLVRQPPASHLISSTLRSSSKVAEVRQNGWHLSRLYKRTRSPFWQHTLHACQKSIRRQVSYRGVSCCANVLMQLLLDTRLCGDAQIA